MEDPFRFDSPPASLLEKKQLDADLVNWITRLGGGLNPAVEIYRDTEKGACLRVRSLCSLDAASIVARCPVSATISIINVLNIDPELPEHDFPCSDTLSQSSRKSVILAFFVAHQQLKGRDSHWWPYLATLPRASEITSTLFYQGNDLDWLQNTNLYHTRQAYYDTLKSEYDSTLSLLREEGYKFAESFSWSLFSWAYTILSSRSFTSRVMQTYLSKKPELHHVQEFQVLLPLVDSSNHQPLAKIEWRAEATEIGLKTVDPVPAEGEVHNNYGPLNNQQLMTTYGFCVANNVCDYRDLNVHAPPDSPLASARAFRSQEFHEPQGKTLEDKCFIFNVFYPLPGAVKTAEEHVFSPGLLDALALTRVNTRETQSIEVTEDRTYANLLTSGSRVALNALCQGSVELAFRISKFKKGGYLEKQAQNEKQRMAQVYRQSEWSIHMVGLVICEWAIQRATSRISDISEPLLRKYLSYIPDLSTRERLEELLRDSGSIVKQHGELIRGSNVATLIPSHDIKQDLKSLVENVFKYTATKSNQESLTSDTLIYAIFLLICVTLNERNKTEISKHTDSFMANLLPKRVESYINQLINWYPLNNSQPSFSEPDEDLELEIRAIHAAIMDIRSKIPSTFASLKKLVGPSGEWLSGDMLKWAILVIKEEEVTIMRDPLEMVSGNSDKPFQVIVDSYFYCPQLPTTSE